MARLGPRFRPQKSPWKSSCGSLFCVLSQKMRHINFLLGPPKWGFWVGCKKFMLKKFMCFFRPLSRKSLWSREVPIQIAGHPGHSCLKEQNKAPCIKFLSGTSQAQREGCPDVPGISCPKSLFLGCFFCHEWKGADVLAKNWQQTLGEDELIYSENSPVLAAYFRQTWVNFDYVVSWRTQKFL